MLGKDSAGSTLLVSAWAVLVVAGFATLLRYDSTPGAATAPAPSEWPADAAPARTPRRPTLLVFLHPRCPCSDATLGELEEILAKSPKTIDARVVFVAPDGTPADWTHGDLRARAGGIPGVVVSDDAGGVLAARFGAETSGTTLVYDAQGRLAFRGGLTPSRGHMGDNAGRSAVLALLGGAEADAAATPVFGCPLLGAKDAR
jgi:hypothetical protein